MWKTFLAHLLRTHYAYKCTWLTLYGVTSGLDVNESKRKKVSDREHITTSLDAHGGRTKLPNYLFLKGFGFSFSLSDPSNFWLRE